MNGWDQRCLTEDADIGIRLSAMGIPIRVVYEDAHVTREETPPTVEQSIAASAPVSPPPPHAAPPATNIEIATKPRRI